MSRLSSTVFGLCLLGALASHPAAAVQRAFVASYGSDANAATTSCSLAGPCRGFTAAMGVVDAGGEVVALDAAGYGSVAITKSVTITANPGFFAGISATSGNAVTVSGAGVNVTLRGLNINSLGATVGVNMFSGNRLSIENCILSNFNTNAVRVDTAATLRIVDSTIRDNFIGINLENGATASISGTRVLGNSSSGISVNADSAVITTAAISDSVLATNSNGLFVFASNASGTARASITRSMVTNNLGNGIFAAGGAGTETITLSDNLVTGNSGGIVRNPGGGAGGQVRTRGNNTVDQNGSDTVGTLTEISGM